MYSNAALAPATNVARIILSVDDNPLVLRTRQIVLEAAGYDVLSASNGEQALSLFDAVRVDLVLLDYSMPGIDGMHVAKQIKASRPLLPIILATGLPIADESLPCVDWIYRKGDGPSSLLAKITQLLPLPPAAPRVRGNLAPKAALEILGVYRPFVTAALFEAQKKLYEDEDETRLHFDRLVLIEAIVHGSRDLKGDDFCQETPDYGTQSSYGEALLSSDGDQVIVREKGCICGTPPLRCAFYLHFYDHQSPLRWTHGEILCPPPREMPERLQRLVPYSPVD